MSVTVTVRRAVPGDYEVICELADLMDAPQHEALPDRFRKPSGPVRLRDRTERLMHDPDTFLAVAELDGRIVGVTNCGLLRMGDFPQKHLEETRSSKSESRFKPECSNADRPYSFGIRVSIVIRDSSFGIVLYDYSLPPRSSPRLSSVP